MVQQIFEKKKERRNRREIGERERKREEKRKTRVNFSIEISAIFVGGGGRAFRKGGWERKSKILEGRERERIT